MEMKQYNSLLLLMIIFSLTTISSGVQVINKKPPNHHRYGRRVKLFVFGDSYVDTGNFKKNEGSWIEPYGYSFPGKPSGRFSDGRVLTDYIASFIGIRSPIPYKWRKFANKTQLKRGMNFAYGGSGVFNTWIKDLPNLKLQISLLKRLLHQKVYTKRDLANSVVLVSFSGNDYAFYLQKNGTLQDMPNLTRRVINQLVKNLRHIHQLGIGKIAVVGMGPAGCFPQETASSSYQSCNKSFNLASKFHNHMLQRALRKLNNQSKKPVFIFLDLYSSFITAMDLQKHKSENIESKNPLKPCCQGVTNKNAGGQRDENGEKKYVICKHPELSFFWDLVHPSQNGWHTVYLTLQPTLKRLLI